MDLNLEGKNAIVFGGSQGLGFAAALELSELGASVTLASRSESKLATAVKQLHVNGEQQHDFIAVDMFRTDQFREKLADHFKNKRKYQILINNSGGPAPGFLSKAAPKDLLTAFAQHVVCAQIVTQMLLPTMKAAKFGRIVNIVSTGAKEPVLDLGVSNTIRGAMVNWSKLLATELASYGITVNNILPGFIDTERMKTILKDRSAQTGKSEEEELTKVIERIPIKRAGQPNELGAAVAFLASPAASYINGISLSVDGGRSKSL